MNWIYFLKTCSFTVKTALYSTLLAFLIGLPMAFFTANRKFFAKKFILSLSAIPLCVPALLAVLGYVGAFGVNGIFNRIIRSLFGFNSSASFLYGFWGIIFVQGFYNFPIIMKTVNDSWKSIPQTQSFAARLLGASEFRIFFSITLIQLLPSIISSCILVFLMCFFSFFVVLMLGPVGCSTLETSLYHSFKVTQNFRLAGFIAVSETLISVLFLLVHSFIENKGKSLREVSFVSEEKKLKDCKIAERLCFFALMVIVCVCFILPFSMIAISAFASKNNSFTLKNFAFLFGKNTFLKAFLNTVFYGSLAAFFSTAIAFFTSFFLHKQKLDASIFAKILMLLPLSVSSVVLCFVFTRLFPVGKPLYIVVIQVIMYFSYAFKQISVQMQKIPLDIEDAERILSGSFSCIYTLHLPMCKKAILRSFCFCFALSAGDATVPLVLAVPKYTSLALETYRLAGSYRFGQACACGTILSILIIGITAFSNAFETLRLKICKFKTRTL